MPLEDHVTFNPICSATETSLLLRVLRIYLAFTLAIVFQNGH